MSKWPLFVSGEVVSGFGRGSKQLGIPTANFPRTVIDTLPNWLETGVYYGWAKVDDGGVYKMVLSVGLNPHFGNTSKTMETHILHRFPEDFYGSLLRVAIVGFVRHMESYPSLDELIVAIRRDIEFAECALIKQDAACIAIDSFFNGSGGSSTQVENNAVSKLAPPSAT